MLYEVITHSGIRLKVVECMVDMLNKGVTPVVYDKGSVDVERVDTRRRGSGQLVRPHSPSYNFV